MCWKIRKDAVKVNQVQVVPSPTIHAIATTLVNNNVITADEAKTQVTAINNFFEGKISYAEMRRLAG